MGCPAEATPGRYRNQVEAEEKNHSGAGVSEWLLLPVWGCTLNTDEEGAAGSAEFSRNKVTDTRQTHEPIF